MRHYLKSLIITAASFYIAIQLVPTIKIGSDPKNIFLVIGGLWVISHIIKPVFSLVLLPLNLLTLGVLSLIINVGFVFALLTFLPGFKIEQYAFQGANIKGLLVPPIFFSAIMATILVAVIITLSQRLLHVIFE